jgi:hypothetical protein
MHSRRKKNSRRRCGPTTPTDSAACWTRIWAVVDGIGGLNDRESVCAAIKAGTFTRKTYEPDLADARVRVYGNIATITFHLSLSGPFEHKTFSGKEVETDVLQWEDGGWKCVLTHETNVLGTLVVE